MTTTSTTDAPASGVTTIHTATPGTPSADTPPDPVPTPDGIAEVAHRTIDTPVGSLLLAATDVGLLRVAFDREDHEKVLASLSEKVNLRVLRAPHRLDAVAAEIDEYFAGRRRRFELPLDLRLTAGRFYRSVLGELQRIDYGRTASYTAVAAAAGNPKAVRAVGSACATNPIPIVVPCHRVLRSDGKVGQYLGGTSVKQRLLDMEAAAAETSVG